MRYGSGYSLCFSVVGSEHSASPQGQKDTDNLRFKLTPAKQRSNHRKQGYETKPLPCILSLSELIQSALLRLLVIPHPQEYRSSQAAVMCPLQCGDLHHHLRLDPYHSRSCWRIGERRLFPGRKAAGDILLRLLRAVVVRKKCTFRAIRRRNRKNRGNP